MEAACSSGHVKTVKLLIDAGANVNNIDEVSSRIQLLILTFMIMYISKQNFRFERSLLWAAYSKGHVEIAKLLIDAGANVNKTDVVCSSVLLL